MRCVKHRGNSPVAAPLCIWLSATRSITGTLTQVGLCAPADNPTPTGCYTTEATVCLVWFSVSTLAGRSSKDETETEEIKTDLMPRDTIGTASIAPDTIGMDTIGTGLIGKGSTGAGMIDAATT